MDCLLQRLFDGLSAIERSTSRESKQQNACEMFEYVCQNQETLDRCPRLGRLLTEKLKALYHLEGWQEGRAFYLRLTGEAIITNVPRAP
jgi:hypothetical protein